MNWLRRDAVWIGVVYWIVITAVILVAMQQVSTFPMKKPSLHPDMEDDSTAFVLTFAMLFTGFWQLLYAVPLFLWLRAKKPRMATGVMIASAVAFGITGVCTVMVR